MKKRSRLEIINDILNAISEKGGTIKPTHLLYKSNLSHKLMESYLEELIEKGLVEEGEVKRGKEYSITEKGREFISRYRNFVDFIDSYGLEDD